LPSGGKAVIRADRWVIAAVIFLSAGLWTIFNFCHGDAGLSFALPVANSKVSLNVATMGAPVLIGVPLTAIGAVLLAAAFVVAVAEQFTRRGADRSLSQRERDAKELRVD
jgi:hypothetical protein